MSNHFSAEDESFRRDFSGGDGEVGGLQGVSLLK